MCAEVYQHIGFETVLCPQVGSDVGVRWRSVGAVHDLKSIIPFARSVLRKQHDIAELHTCHSKFAVGSCHKLAWELAVCLHHFLVFLWSEGLFHPTVVVVLADEGRLSVLHKVVESTLGVKVEHRPLTLNGLHKSFRRVGQARYIVAFLLQTQQQIVERRSYFHTACSHCVLPWSFIIVDSDTLLTVRLVLQAYVVVHGLYERAEPFGHGSNVFQVVFAYIMGEKSERTQSSVDFGRNYALRKEASVHTHIVALPLLFLPVHVQWSEERHIDTLQIVYESVAQAAVCHIDDSRNIHAVGVLVLYKLLNGIDRIDHIARFLQFGNQFFRLTHRACDDDGRGIVFPKSLFLEELVVFRYGIELLILVVGAVWVGVVNQSVDAFHHLSRFGSIDYLLVDVLTHVAEQVAIVLATAVVDVCFQPIGIGSVYRTEIVVGVCNHRTHHGRSAFHSFFEFGTLFFGQAQAHCLHENHIVAVGFRQVFGGEIFDFDKRIVVGAGYLSERDGLIVHKSYPSGRQPFAPYTETDEQQCCHGSDDKYSSFLHTVRFLVFNEWLGKAQHGV